MNNVKNNSNANFKKNKNKNIFLYLFISMILLAIASLLVANFLNNKHNDNVFLFESKEENQGSLQQEITSKDPFIIGVIMSDYSYEAYKSTLLAVQQKINKNGGIDGRAIKYIKKDGLCTREGGEAAALSLINDFGADVLLGGQCSDEFIGSASISQAAGILSFGSAVTSPEISRLGKYIFRTAVSDDLTGKFAAEFAKDKLMAKTAVLLIEDKTFPLGLGEYFEDEFIAGGWRENSI